MGSIPLPALDIKPMENPLDSYARVMQIKSLMGEQQTRQLQQQGMQQENQQRAIAMQDDQKIRAAVTASVDADGNFDRQKFAQNAWKQGAGPKAIAEFQKSLLAMDQEHAKLTEEQLKNGQTVADQYRGRIQSIVDGPDENKLAAWSKEVGAEEQAYVKSQGQLGVAPGSITHIYPGDDAAQAFANHFAIGSTLAKEKAEQLQAEARNRTSLTGQQEFAAKQNPNNPMYSPTPAYLAGQSAQGNPATQAIQAGMANQAGAVAGAEAKAKQPYQMQLEQVRQQVAQTFQGQKNAQDKIEGTVLKPYEEKMSQITELQSALQQAAQGNVTAARGVLLKLIGVTNPDGTKRYNEAEAQRLLQQGNIGQRFAGTVKNLLTGDQWTDSMQKDMVNFAGAQAQAAKDNLNRGIGNINSLYKTNVGQGLLQNSGGGAASIPANVAKALANVGPGRHKLSDGSVWDKQRDGTIAPAGNQ
ncbi:MAG TPA: hypothetical protein VNH65_03240 [Candidatus Acidoferrum sp.]|nr:hypothetical protein [Candidatus Acidoferrum sp.]